MTSSATQVRRPWRAVARTAVAMFVGVAAMLPALVPAAGLDESAPPIAAALAIASGVTRVLALPQVEAFLQRFGLTAWLAAEPAPTPRHG